MQRWFVAVITAGLLSLPAQAQRITASLGGTVRDPSGASVPGAKVSVTNTATQASVDERTDQNGHFLAPALTPGEYSVTVDANGFKKLERSGISLDVDQTASLDLTLEIGSATESVQVTGEAPMLDTSDAEVGQVISGRNIVNLPLNRRNPFSLILLSPGVTGSVGTSFTSNSTSTGDAPVPLTCCSTACPLPRPLTTSKR